jgi:TATA-binding protein-associated factor Taf7
MSDEEDVSKADEESKMLLMRRTRQIRSHDDEEGEEEDEDDDEEEGNRRNQATLFMLLWHVREQTASKQLRIHLIKFGLPLLRQRAHPYDQTADNQNSLN